MISQIFIQFKILNLIFLNPDFYSPCQVYSLQSRVSWPFSNMRDMRGERNQDLIKYWWYFLMSFNFQESIDFLFLEIFS